VDIKKVRLGEITLFKQNNWQHVLQVLILIKMICKNISWLKILS